MRILTIDEQARDEARRVLDFALQPANWYRPSRGDDSAITPPGDDKRHTAQLDTYRAVFSITIDGSGDPWRHLSISVPSEKYPNPYAAFAIAELFGFRGRDGESPIMPEDWLCHVNEEEHCVVLAQRYRPNPGS